MRVRINSISLVGTTRRVAFEPGLNVITGPIASGKTTLLRFARSVLGSSLDNIPAEARREVTAVAADVTLDQKQYSIVRPTVTTRNARIDIAGDGEALRLPFTQLEPSIERTYVRWLLERLDLPRLEVPSSPTRVESEPTPVTLNDYLLYCTLFQEEIGFAVFGHKDPFKNIKRKYVFEIVYGLYSVETARIQDELRDAQAKLRDLRSQEDLFARFLSDTALQNRAELERSLQAAKTNLNEIEEGVKQIRRKMPVTSAVEELRMQTMHLQAEIAKDKSELQFELAAIDNLGLLAAQLETQIGKLTRAIVANRHLVDIDFIICPRCGSTVEASRGDDEKCYLCLQPPVPSVSRQALIDEQARVEAQLLETEELIRNRKDRVEAIKKLISRTEDDVRRVGDELNFQTHTFISPEVDAVASLATKRAELKSRISQLEDYLKIYGKIDQSRKWTNELTLKKEQLEGELEAATGREEDIKNRIKRLNEQFNAILETFRPPAFGEERVSYVDQRTFLPVYHGRKFDDLSSPGLATLVNVAHALAHQRTSIELDLKLPNILFIDGLSEHLGEEGLDPERVQAVYRYLKQISDQVGDKLQIIVIENEVPDVVRDFVRLELSESDRLIP